MTTSPTHPEDLASRYRRAFAEHGVRALWNMGPVELPTPADTLAITRAFRTHGRMEGRRLAELIEELCLAHGKVLVEGAPYAGGAAQPRGAKVALDKSAGPS